ncbi:MAG: ABC transporter permease subunit, partial [Bacillota bacterium]
MKRELAFAVVVVVVGAIAALFALPRFLSDYYVTLLLPALAYAIALLGFNLLFGYTGLLSFGHALFVAIGAYGTAVLTSKLGVKSFEAILALTSAAAVAVAIPIALLSVRYVKIFFGILTLAFGMLFHSFLFKFYDLTGGDTGIRVLRPSLLGRGYEDLDKTAFLVGPFYNYCVVLLVVLG